MVEEVLQRFDKRLRGLRGTEEATVRSLEESPPGWPELIRIWATRTVQLASIPGYDGRGIVEAFNGDMAESEQRSEDNDTVDELEEMMRKANLG